MLAIRACLLTSLLAWAGDASSYQQLSASAPGKLFLHAESVAKNDIAKVEAVAVDTATGVSKDAQWARLQQLRKVFDTSWRNNLVILPCLVVGSPLFWIWYKLEPMGKGDEIFTAIDADLREVEISRVGASGVALLRRQCDRHTGIMFAFTGIMLQTIFLYFIAVLSGQKIYHETIQYGDGTPTPVALLFCSLFCNTMSCCSSLILGIKCWATKAPEGYQQLHEILVVLDSFVIPSLCAMVGSMYLCTANGISSLVFNATAMAFICSINMQIAGLMSWSLSGHGGRAFQPANVSIKDSENSTQHAHYSFVASVVVAVVTLPLGYLVGII